DYGQISDPKSVVPRSACQLSIDSQVCFNSGFFPTLWIAADDIPDCIGIIDCCQVSIWSEPNQEIVGSVNVLIVSRWVPVWNVLDGIVAGSEVVVVMVDDKWLVGDPRDIDEHVGPI
ncbi:1384_t:CDS:2, partial [Paraglomus occultum]